MANFIEEYSHTKTAEADMATIEKKGIDTAQKEIKEINQPEGTQNHVRLQKQQPNYAKKITTKQPL